MELSEIEVKEILYRVGWASDYLLKANTKISEINSRKALESKIGQVVILKEATFDMCDRVKNMSPGEVPSNVLSRIRIFDKMMGEYITALEEYYDELVKEEKNILFREL